MAGFSSLNLRRTRRSARAMCTIFKKRPVNRLFVTCFLQLYLEMAKCERKALAHMAELFSYCG